MSQTPLRIAMWSGPRNMSTTMMRSFGARSDTICVDEPFYAAYLKHSGAQHPMQDEIFATQSDDPRIVAAALVGAPALAAPIVYQKHMTHHMLPDFDRAWMAACRNVFLIRHPARVIASYARKMNDVTLSAIGFAQQLRLFDTAQKIEGQTPLVIDSDDILRAPAETLRALCSALRIAWDPVMLAWPSGPRPEDGAWAPHWYDAVWKSTGFGPPVPDLPRVAPEYQAVLREATNIYEQLATHRIRCGAQDR
ncbi:MAG: HAD family hydrolase [Pseudomonadota bacterium]